MLELKIERDNDPINPREGYHIGTMVCWHSRYDLGDEKPTCDPDEYEFPKDCIQLPLYLYDHSGITMATHPITGCCFDEGVVGWIFVSRKKVREEYGWKRITAEREMLIRQYLKSEVEQYDQYLTGDVWYYDIEDESGDILDSCCGFYGEEYCRQEGAASLKWWEREITEENELQYLEEING